MIQQTETRFRINDWKNYSYIFSSFNPQSTQSHIQLHVYDGVRYKQDEEQTQEKEHFKKKRWQIPFWFYNSCICLILCNKQKNE